VSGHVFVDETKDRDYLLVAGVVMPPDLDPVRRTLRTLVMPGQRRLHMAKERDQRRRQIVDAIVASGVTATVYDAGRSRRTELAARGACLRAVVIDAAEKSAHMLVLKQDDSLLWWDQQRLIEITREVGCRDTLRYEHRRAREELLLAIPDAIAWCWARGGTWRQRVEPVVIKRQSV